MKAKEQLYYLLEHYFKGNYTTETFTDEFSRIYNLETDYRLLSESEHKKFGELAATTNYFSPYEEDLKNCPNLFTSAQDVKRKATEVYLELNKSAFCPLLNREICQGECYDIQMVRCRAIKESILGFPLDRAQADTICESCDYNQLPSI